MSSKTDFSEKMRQRSDADLVDIVTRLREDYQPEAVLAAEEELKSRDLPAEQIEALQEAANSTQEALDEKANEPLEGFWRVLCFLIPGGINLVLSFIFKAQGYDRKFTEAWKWTFYGFGFYIAVGLLMVGMIKALG